MQSILRQKWKIWKHRRRRRIAARHLQKRRVVLQKGILLHVYVLDVYPTRISLAELKLVRLQLHIRLLNNNCLCAISFAFINHDCTSLKGEHIRIRFLPGDLSHVVLII